MMPMMQEQENSACIFVADDEAANLRLLEKMLASGGYQNAVLIDDARSIVDRYQSARPDLILLDVNMPYLDGYEVLRQLQELGDPLLPPAMIMTAEPDRAFLVRAHEAGARDFLTKPYDRVELLMRVRNLLEIQAARRSQQERGIDIG
jgi:putative two-component system response regulator